MKNLIKKLTPYFLISFYHFLLAFFGAIVFRFPSRDIKVIGITGTKGKSSVVEMAGRILEEAGYKTAFISSIEFKINQSREPNLFKMTMPGRFFIQRFLRKAVNAGCHYVILEVTSEGILQHRHRFIDFEAVVFTNLSPEHIERHGSFENYKKAKGKLFKQCPKIHILNLDDENVDYFLRFTSREKIGYGINWKLKIVNCKFIKAANIEISEYGLSFYVNDVNFNLKILGGFNVYNALAAICVSLSQGVNLETCKKALEKIKGIEGRMEVVLEKPFRVIVDYAHTPDSLEKVYKNVSSFKFQDSRLICVLGAAGGGRDKWKRPKMGEIAARYCDEIILTNEDPYDENPAQILAEIEAGIRGFKFQVSGFRKIFDRREAINKALQLAKTNDSVVITGKGCEPWICIAKGRKIPWDDRRVVREELEKLKIPLAP